MVSERWDVETIVGVRCWKGREGLLATHWVQVFATM